MVEDNAPPEHDQEVVEVAVGKLTEQDQLVLSLAKQKRQTALAEAKAALSNNEKEEMNYKYEVLQLYMKYGLSKDHGIRNDGVIIHYMKKSATEDSNGNK